MTVQELIDRLGQFPPTATVVVGDSIVPYVLDTLKFSSTYHTMRANVQPCSGPGCVLCQFDSETVEAVVL